MNCCVSIFKNNSIIKAIDNPRVKTGFTVLLKVIGSFGIAYIKSEKTREQWAFAFKNKKAKHVKVKGKNLSKIDKPLVKIPVQASLQSGQDTPKLSSVPSDISIDLIKVPSESQIRFAKPFVFNLFGHEIREEEEDTEERRVEEALRYRSIVQDVFDENAYEQSLFDETLDKTSKLAAELFEQRNHLPSSNALNIASNYSDRLFKEMLFKRTLASFLELKIRASKGFHYLLKVEPPKATKELFGSHLYMTRLDDKVTYLAKLALLGQGSSNRVYLAVNILEGRVCVMRELIVQDGEEQGALAKEVELHQEIYGIEELSSKVVKIWASFQNVLILSLANRGSLSSAIRNNLFTESQKKEILIQIITFLQNFHDYGFVYGDLKSANILIHVSSSGAIEVKFADFGGSYKEGQLPKNVITLSYMAPELYVEQGQTNQLTDLWVLGLIMYEMKYRQDSDERGTDYLPEFINSALKSYNRFVPETGYAANKIIREALLTPEKYFDVSNAYDALMMGFLAFKPEERISPEEALELLHDVPLSSFSRKFKETPKLSSNLINN